MNAILLFDASQLGNNIHPFVTFEVDAFCAKYDQVYLICFDYHCDDAELKRHQNLHIITVPLKKAKTNILGLLRMLTPYGIKDLMMAIKAGILNTGYLVETARVLMFGDALARKVLKVLKNGKDKQWVVESYWLSGTAYAAARAKKKYPHIVAVSRSHSAEADPVRNKYCVCQMKNYIYRYLDRIFFVSQWGMDNFEKIIMPRYGYKTCDKAQVSRLGTVRRQQSRNQGSQDDVIRIVTCSRVVKLKRLELIAGALQKWDGTHRLHWTHIGDGPDMENIRKMTEGFGPNVSCHFLGYMSNDQVHAFFATEPVDLFVNVSRFEGLPVSIMEAQSYGIPCLATDAGGTRELVDDSTGYLLPVECTDEDVLAALKALADRLSKGEERAALQQVSFDTWDNLCDKEKNYRDFFEALDALTEQGHKSEV